MAELLIKAVDAVHPDPRVDRAGCYKRGDLVVVSPDEHPWGAEERNPAKFRIVRVTGAPAEVLSKYLEPETDPADTEGSSLTRRRWSFAELSSGTNTDTVLTWRELRGFIRDKVTGATETKRSL